MKRKISWMLLSFLLVAALVLASCAEEVPGEQEEEEEEEEVGVPQYGGTITWFGPNAYDPPAPDIQLGPHGFLWWIGLAQENPVSGNFEKYGPRGTGEFKFQTSAYIPEEFLEGMLIESWEVTPTKMTWQVRPGIYWAPTEDQIKRGVMEAPRELTAEDIVADMLYYREAPGGKTFKAGTTDVYATGKYSLVIETPKFNSGLLYLVTYEDRALYSPPEQVAAGADKWENQIGTGPFMFEEYVIGSYMSFVRNPDYWRTTTIDGVEYEIPFVDRIVLPIMPDPSTQIAALRTATIDYHQNVQNMYWDSLEVTTPLLFTRALMGNGLVVAFNTRDTESPVSNRDVRRALMVGTDLKAVNALVGLPGMPLHWFPGGPDIPTSYTPLEELPAETRLLFDYNPTLAKQMLADAGYPAGFKMEMQIRPFIADGERGALLEDQWAEIGVDLELVVMETTAWAARRYTLGFGDATIAPMEITNPQHLLRWGHSTLGPLNMSGFTNARFDELVETGTGTVDSAEANVYFKEAALLFLNEVGYLCLDMSAVSPYWWPWIKNYYGETNITDASQVVRLFAYMWIDQDLKEEMGYD